MRLRKSIQVVDTHNAGEPMRIITGGLPPIFGKSMAQKGEYFKKNLDAIRRLTMLEPRGHSDMFGGILCDPVNPQAHLGVLFFDAGNYYSMCGHGAMAVAMVAVEMGLVKREPNETQVLLDTPAGLLSLQVKEKMDQRIVTMESNPSFLQEEDLLLEIPSHGQLRVDIAYGGNFFALVNQRDVKNELILSQVPSFLRLGMEIMAEVNRILSFCHPLHRHIREVTDVMFYEVLSPTEGRNLVVLGKGQFDRSPCGTGTAARLATMYDKKELSKGIKYKHRSILDTSFTAWVKEEEKVGTKEGVIVAIESTPFFTGFNHLLVEEGDPLGEGFFLKRYSSATHDS